ncbi:MAG TPA: hypothetical protein VIU46_06555 [Gallionellaceae bacterium]
MSDETDNPVLNTAFALMNAAVPGVFDDPVKAWEAYVPSLRYVVIAKTESPSTEQLRVVQGFASSFYNFSGNNLLEIRKALVQSGIKLEPAPENIARLCQEALVAAGLQATLEPLTEDEIKERFAVLDEFRAEEALRNKKD